MPSVQGREVKENLLKNENESWCKWLDIDARGTTWAQFDLASGYAVDVGCYALKVRVRIPIP
jgi:hypothetical protein